MPKLYEVENALESAHERLSDLLFEQEQNLDPALNADLAVAERSLVTEIEAAMLTAAEKRDGCAMFVRRLDADAEYIKAEAVRLGKLLTRIQSNRERFLAYVKQVMESHNLECIEGRTSRFKLVQNPPSVDVGTFLPEQLPPECVRVIPERKEPNKVEIGKRLKAGEDVPGCRLLPGGHRLALSDKKV